MKFLKLIVLLSGILLCLSGCSKNLSASDKEVCDLVENGDFFKVKMLVSELEEQYGSMERCFTLTECSNFYYSILPAIYSKPSNETYTKIENPELKEAMKFIADLQWPSDIPGKLTTKLSADSKVIAFKSICNKYN